MAFKERKKLNLPESAVITSDAEWAGLHDALATSRVRGNRCEAVGKR